MPSRHPPNSGGSPHPGEVTELTQAVSSEPLAGVTMLPTLSPKLCLCGGQAWPIVGEMIECVCALASANLNNGAAHEIGCMNKTHTHRISFFSKHTPAHSSAIASLNAAHPSACLRVSISCRPDAYSQAQAIPPLIVT